MKQSEWRKVKTQNIKKVLDFEVKLQMTWITEEMLERGLDPLELVLNKIDPHHDQFLRPEVHYTPERPQNASKGIFRVIYNEKNGETRKVKSHAVEAKDGFDAVNAFCNIGDNIFAEARGDIQIIGMQCQYIPFNVMRKFQEEWQPYGILEETETLARAALLNLIAKLEVFRDEPPPNNLRKFLGETEK